MKQVGTLFLLIAMVSMLNGCKPEPKTEPAKDPELPNTVTLSPQAVQRSGLQTLIVSKRTASSELTTVAEVRADQNRVFHINPPMAGRVIQDRVILGDSVKSGQVLAVLQNVEVARVNADYIHQLHQNEVDTRQAQTRLSLAQRNLEREKRLLSEGISPRKDYYQAETDFTLAQSSLEGLREHATHVRSEAKALLNAYGSHLGSSHSESISTNSLLTTPRAGVITQKNVVIGDMVSPDKTLYEVADLAQVWLDVVLYPKDIEQVKLGQPVTFTSDSMPGQRFLGQIRYLQPAASAQSSQTFLARVFMENPGRLLKPGLMGQATIQTESHAAKPFVPQIAIQKYGKEAFVFLDRGNSQFQKQVVTLGEHVTEGYFIQSGIKPGDRIVGKGSFTLKAEMLKSQFGEEE